MVPLVVAEPPSSLRPARTPVENVLRGFSCSVLKVRAIRYSIDMANEGLLEFDRGSVIGKVRIMSGDSTGESFDPPKYDDDSQELAEYELWSDEEIRGFLDVANNSPTRAIGYGFIALASQAALESRSVKDYDLQVDLTKRATDLRATAKEWFDRADNEDTNSEGFDLFQVFDVIPGPTHYPEAMPRWH